MTDNNPTIQEQADTIFGEKYLRNRPFLVITETSRPAAGTKTEKAGWKATSLQYFEQPMVVDRVQNKLLISASLIIDIVNRKLIKNPHAGKLDDETVLERYLDKYAEQVTDGLRIWAQRSALNIAKNTVNA